MPTAILLVKWDVHSVLHTLALNPANPFHWNSQLKFFSDIEFIHHSSQFLLFIKLNIISQLFINVGQK